MTRSSSIDAEQLKQIEKVFSLPSETLLHSIAFQFLLCTSWVLLLTLVMSALPLTPRGYTARIFVGLAQVSIGTAVYSSRLKAWSRGERRPNPFLSWNRKSDRRPRNLVRVNVNANGNDLVRGLLEQTKTALGRSAMVELYWDPWDPRVSGQTRGTDRAPRVTLGAGVLELLEQRSRNGEFVLLHELAHLANKDLSLFTRISVFLALWRALVPLLLISGFLGFWWSVAPLTTSGGPMLFFYVIGVFLAGAGAVAAAVVLQLFFVRYYSFVVSLRESYADARAVSWQGTVAGLRELVGSTTHRRARWRWLTGRFTHLPAQQRLVRIEHPELLVYPSTAYLFAVAVGVLLLEHAISDVLVYTAFVGVVWAVVGVAYLFDNCRWALACAQGIATMTVGQTLKLTVAASVFLMAPWLRWAPLENLLATVVVSGRLELGESGVRGIDYSLAAVPVAVVAFVLSVLWSARRSAGDTAESLQRFGRICLVDCVCVMAWNLYWIINYESNEDLLAIGSRLGVLLVEWRSLAVVTGLVLGASAIVSHAVLRTGNPIRG